MYLIGCKLVCPGIVQLPFLGCFTGTAGMTYIVQVDIVVDNSDRQNTSMTVSLSILILLTLHIRNYTILLFVLWLLVSVISDLKL